MPIDPELQGDANFFAEPVSQREVRRENRSKEFADGARFCHWVGLTLLGTFVVNLINAAPFRLTDTAWQLNFITLMMNNGGVALLGALMICLARLFNLNDRQIRSRAQLLRTLATWVAVGWLLLIPLQLFLGVRLMNTLASREAEQIQLTKRVSRAVAQASSEAQLARAMAQIPNQPPLPRLTIPLEVAKTNLLAQFERTINTLNTRQEEASSERWQTFLREAIRNSLHCLLLGLGFLAIGKRRSLPPSSFAGPIEIP